MEKIGKYQHEIEKLHKELELYQGEKWVEENVAQPADLFDENPQVQFVTVDKNKRERTRINAAISQFEQVIENEKINVCHKDLRPLFYRLLTGILMTKILYPNSWM